MTGSATGPTGARRGPGAPGARPDVVVTGMGATTPVGGDLASSWQGVLDARSGTRLLTESWAAELPVRLAATASTDPGEVLGRVEARRLDRGAQLAMVAAREAWADAGAPEVDGERLAVVVSSGIGGVTTLLDAYDTLLRDGARRVSPLTVPLLMPNGPAAAVALELGARAGAHTPVSACASGAEAVALGTAMIRDGRADVVVVGGTEAAVHALPLAAFAAMRALSSRHDAPEDASRPFDKGRDGFVLAEGAAVLVLERADYAAARGARVHGRVLGTGSTSDAHHLVAPDPTGAGAGRAVTLALADAGLEPGEVSHVNAHATGTPTGDVAEVAALHRSLGEHPAAVVSSTKGSTGHLLGAAGALEAAFALLAVRDCVVPPVRNLEDPDDACDLDVVRVSPRSIPAGGVALSTSFGFGGHNVALVVAAP